MHTENKFLLVAALFLSLSPIDVDFALICLHFSHTVANFAVNVYAQFFSSLPPAGKGIHIDGVSDTDRMGVVEHGGAGLMAHQGRDSLYFQGWCPLPLPLTLALLGWRRLRSDLPFLATASPSPLLRTAVTLPDIVWFYSSTLDSKHERSNRTLRTHR